MIINNAAAALLSLPDVTLVCVDTVNPELAIAAMQHCMAHARFGHVLLLTAQPMKAPAGITVELIDGVNDIESYSEFVIRQLGQYFNTTHALLVQWDGFIIHPDRWDPAFLNYDYIGATWPKSTDHPEMVGNGGFSLRSKSLLQTLQKIAFTQFHPEDELIARRYRSQLESAGIRFAPPEIGDHFAYEFKKPSIPAFGFHGFSNFPDFMNPNELASFIQKMPAGLIFNNYFLEFMKKVLSLAKTMPAARHLRQALIRKVSLDISCASPKHLVSNQAKHLISGLCRLRLGSLARQLSLGRFRAAPNPNNIRLVGKSFFVR